MSQTVLWHCCWHCRQELFVLVTLPLSYGGGKIAPQALTCNTAMLLLIPYWKSWFLLSVYWWARGDRNKPASTFIQVWHDVGRTRGGGGGGEWNVRRNHEWKVSIENPSLCFIRFMLLHLTLFGWTCFPTLSRVRPCSSPIWVRAW